MTPTTRAIAVAAIGLALGPASAQAQVLRSQQVASGLASPLGFVQDPTNPNVQFIVQKTGAIRTFVNGVVGGNFLSLVGQVSTGFEQGLLGLAFAPDYATSRRFYVNFTNTSGDTVVARFRRDAVNPLLADPASRFDLRWPIVVGQPQRQAWIDQPAANHNGGNLMFGPDGFLYIGMGDGGPGNDPNNQAQTPGSLLGKMLRINVNVPDGDAEGYDVPANNPFLANSSVFPEIWAFGFRNPWRYTFDNPALGGTGALLIADVGQITWEEVNYEPAGAGGRNYGWRNREGAHDHITTLPPFSTPLRDPFYEYFHDIEDRSITGGYVYRGNDLGAFNKGRYFFADLFGKVWSIGLTIDGSGEATYTPGSLIDHTATMDPLLVASDAFITAFGEDSRGELYILTLTGRIFRLYLELTSNGDFSNGMASWGTFATPDQNYIVAGVVGGVLEFYRQPPPPGDSNQAVVLQPTGVVLAANARFVAQFDLGNSSSVRKRVTVLLHDADFSDLTACTFWLAPGAPMRTYRMFGHATEAWANATIAFYAATPGSNGGAYRLDNVSLRPDFAVSDERTDCVDPTVPAAPGGADGPDVVVNGGFGTGTLPPWGVFGQIVWQIAGGVFEFYRPAGLPAGVLLQQTGANVIPNAILTATFQLGNSSGVRKRVTVLLHSADFSDLAACTFWLPAGQPLGSYSMRTFATQAWTNATVSVYPGTVGIDLAIRLDDVTFRATPSQTITGTECIEPVTPAPGLAATSVMRPRMAQLPASRRED